jgi:hypothetical protein
MMADASNGEVEAMDQQSRAGTPFVEGEAYADALQAAGVSTKRHQGAGLSRWAFVPKSSRGGASANSVGYGFC